MTKEEKIKANKEKAKIYRISNKEKHKDYMKSYRISNKEKYKDYMKDYRISNKDYMKTYRISNKDIINSRAKSYYCSNKDIIKAKAAAKYRDSAKYSASAKYRDSAKYSASARARAKSYYYSNKDKINFKMNIYIKKRKKEDILFNIKNNISSLIRLSIKSKGFKKNSKTEIILGCSMIEFKIHIESKFEPWMTWDNKGHWDGHPKTINHSWDIDHIIPTSSAKTEEDVIRLNHYTNLQPLCSYINRHIKRDKL